MRPEASKTLKDLLKDVQKKKPPQREAKFWGEMKRAFTKAGWHVRRVETKYKDGFPDVMAVDPSGRIHLIELKHTNRNKIDLSPLQVSFHQRCGNSGAPTWILVKYKTEAFFLYHGSQAVDVAVDNLSIKPYMECLAQEGPETIVAALETADVPS